MARSKRASVPSGYFEITTRTANNEKWFAEDGFKDEIVEKLYGIVAFSGVKLLAWCICDDGIRLVIHVPNVPRHFYPDKNAVPAAYAFGMRPNENRPQMWMPIDWDYTNPIPQPPRPEVGFTIPDEEMLGLLFELYRDPKQIEAKRKLWMKKRVAGKSDEVDAEKRRYCHRMFNMSQFMKTLNEWLAQEVNRRTKHAGHVFSGRFESLPVECAPDTLQLAMLETDYEPYRCGLVDENEFYHWSSFGQAACGGRYGFECQSAYETVWGSAVQAKSWQSVSCDSEDSHNQLTSRDSEDSHNHPAGDSVLEFSKAKWKDVRDLIVSQLRERVERIENLDELVASGKIRLTRVQIVKLGILNRMHVHYIGLNKNFIERLQSQMEPGYPIPSPRSFFDFIKIVEWSSARAS